MLYPLSILSLLLLALIHLTHGESSYDSKAFQSVLTSTISSSSNDTTTTIPLSTREYWMRRANSALADLISPCPFAAFGTVIVNHSDTSDDARGKLVCMGANNQTLTGNPTLHGEIAAINNCTTLFTNAAGPYNMTSSEALTAFTKLSLYTNAESCPMCASAIRWAGFREYVFGTAIETLIAMGWSQIDISSREVFQDSAGLGEATAYLGGVLANETDPYFVWQFDEGKACPHGCERQGDGGGCAAAPVV